MNIKVFLPFKTYAFVLVPSKHCDPFTLRFVNKTPLKTASLKFVSGISYLVVEKDSNEYLVTDKNFAE